MTGVPRKPLPVLALSRSDVDRASWNRDVAGLLDDPSTRVLVLTGNLLAVEGEHLALRAPQPDDAEHPLLYLGEADGVQHVAVLRPAVDGEPHPGWATLRAVGMSLDARDIGLASTAVAMSEWHRSTRFCARCGGSLDARQGGWLRVCADGHESYPSTSPAVIMAVVDDDDRLLLARGTRWGAANRSVLAGFVEPGESLESAVRREVREEAGIDVVDVRYEGNQPWPFPASLMVAFTCRATSTDLAIDPAELADARWYTRDELAAAAGAGEISLPAPLSVAHHLIAQWYGGPPPGARAV